MPSPEVLEARQLLSEVPAQILAAGKKRPLLPLADRVPGEPGETTLLTVDYLTRRARFRSELGLFLVDDARGRIGTLKPGDRGYAAAALSRRTVLFRGSDGPGAVGQVALPAGSHFGTYLIQNGSSDTWLKRRGAPASGRKPIAFFSFKAANADRFAHVRSPRPGIQAWEDLWKGGDRDFDDVVLRFRFKPAAPPIDHRPSVTIEQPAEGLLTNRDVLIVGQALDAEGEIVAVEARLDGGPFVDVPFGADGRFQFAAGLLLDGTQDRPHTIEVRARDGSSQFSDLVPRSFTLDSRRPGITFGLDPAADTAPVGDDRTMAHLVSLVGETEPHLIVTLLPIGTTTTADASGRFVFTSVALAAGANAFAVEARDAAGNVGRAERTITLDDCGFDSQLTGWIVDQQGGGSQGQGTVGVESGAAVLREGNSFNVTLSGSFVVPANPTSISFEYANLAFDTTDPSFINDAFEVALLGENGASLVTTFTTGRDAFFNITEGQNVATGSGVTVAGQRVTVDISQVIPGTTATLVFRLVNNDGDTLSTVAITCVMGLPYDGSQPRGPTFGPGLSGRQPEATSAAALTTSSSAGASSRSQSTNTSHNDAGASIQGLGGPPAQSELGDSMLDANGNVAFTTSEDFLLGSLFNTDATTIQDEVRLVPPGEARTFPFIWISNSAEGTVSRFDTVTGKELGRYRTGPSGGAHSPSRTAVASDGSVWVANRAYDIQASVVHVLLEDFIDRNGNGVVDTSTDLNANGRIDPNEILPWDANGDDQPDDERIALSIPVGRSRSDPNAPQPKGVARSVSLDANDDVWVGLFNFRQYEVYDHTTGALKRIVPVSGTPYGSVVDAKGILWSANRDSYFDRIDMTTNVATTVSHGGGDNYGITLDGKGVVWTATYNSSQLKRYDPATGELDTYGLPGNGRGVGAAADGTIWVATNNPDRLVRFNFDSDGRTLLGTVAVPVGAAASAAVIDADGFVWTTTYADNKAWKIDPATNAVVPGWPIATGLMPYNYSDMTGQVRLTVTERTGVWTEIIDGERPGVPWVTVGLETDTPPETLVRLRVRSSDNREVLASLPWLEVEHDSLFAGVQGRYLEVEVSLRSRDPNATPTVGAIDVVTVPIPTVAVDLPDRVDASTTIVLAGAAAAAQPLLPSGAIARNFITHVTVNGQPVDVLDASGRFYTRVPILPGDNTFEVVATDLHGQSVATSVVVEGIQRSPAEIDFSTLADITASFDVEYARTSFHADDAVLYADVAVRNGGAYPIDAPLYVAITNLDDPRVVPIGVHGFTPDGMPYYDVSGRVPGGRLAPDGLTTSFPFAFSNPERVQFDYDLVFFGLLNRAPNIGTVPVIEAIVGRTYRYDVDATDPDGDTATYRLVTRPEGMTINADTGDITWSPDDADVGHHPVTVRVEDGRGGFSEQSYDVMAIVAPPNRPPVFTSLPVIEAHVGLPYTYDADAADADGDTLEYAVIAGPEGMTIDRHTGSVSWTPTAAQRNSGGSSSASADPSLPVAPGFDVSVYAAVIDPVNLSFDPLGNLYVGRDNGGSGGGNADAVKIHRIYSGGMVVGEYGNAPIGDPDGVFFDRAGTVSGFAGAVLVSGLTAGATGSISAILPDGSIHVVAGPSTQIGNANFMRLDGRGRLIFDNLSTGQVLAYRDGVVSTLFTDPSPANDVAIDGSDRIYAIGTDGTVRVHDADGTLLSPSFATGFGAAPSMVIGPGGAWGTDLYISNSVAGQLVRLNSLGQTTIVANGLPSIAGMAFGPDGSLYLSAFDEDRILRIAPSRATLGLDGSEHRVLLAASDGRGGVARQEYTICVTEAPGNHAPVIVSQPVTLPAPRFGSSQVVYFGEDINRREEGTDNNDTIRIAHPLADAAQAAFLARLQGVHTETFESYAPGSVVSSVSFGPDTASLSPPSEISTYPSSDFAPNGGFPISGNQSLGFDTGSINVRSLTFSSPQAAFGFFGVDVEAVGNLVLRFHLADGVSTIDRVVPTTAGTGGANNTGSVMYFGVVDPQHPFTRVDFIRPLNQDDGFQFDDMTIGRPEFVVVSEYRYDVEAVDPDPADTLTYSLVAGPEGMTIEPDTGVIAWPVTSEHANQSFPGTVRVEDGRGGFDEQTFAITVGGTGEIKGTKFNDLNGTGVRDIMGLPPSETIRFDTDQGMFGESTETDIAVTFDPFTPTDIDIYSSITLGGITFQPGETGGYRAPNLAVGTPTFPDTDFGLPLTSNVLTVSGNENFDIIFADPPTAVGFDTITNFSATKPIVSVFDTDDVLIGTYTLTQAPDTFGFVGITSRVPIGRVHWLAHLGGIEDTGIDNVRVGSALFEPGLPGWTIYLDHNQNGRRDPEDQSTTTDATGNYSFPGLPAGTYVVAEEPKPGWIQTAPAAGTHTVIVSEGQVVSGIDFGNQQTDSTDNRDPILAPPPEDKRSARTNTLYRIDAVASDPDGDPLTFSLPVAPQGMTVHPTLGVVVWTPTADQVGTHQVVLRVQDDKGGVAIQSFEIVVAAINSAPVVTSSPRGPATVGLPFVYPILAQDAENNPLTFTLETSTPPDGLALSPEGQITWTPTEAQVGVHPLVVLVGDGANTVRHEFTLTVVESSVNEAPVVDVQARSTARIGTRYDALIDAFDPNGDPLTFTAITKPDGMTIDAATGVIAWIPTDQQLGPHTIEVAVSDGRLDGTVTRTFSVEVLSLIGNQAPRITSTPRLVATVDRLYTSHLAAIDADGDPLLWSLDTAPRGMSIDPRLGTLRWTPAADQMGPQPVVVRVTDPSLAAHTQSFSVLVSCVNQAPVITSRPPTLGYAGDLYIYAVRADDPEGDALTFKPLAAPTDMTIHETTGVIRWTPTAGQAGAASVVIQVDDGQGNLATQSFTIEVSATPRNQAPIITSRPVAHATADGSYTYQLVARDPEGESLRYELISGPAGMQVNEATGLVTWSPVDNTRPTHTVSVAAFDPQDSRALQTFVLEVRANAAPAITSSPVRSGVVGSPYRYDVRASDPNGDPLRYRLTTAPTGMTIDAFGRVTWSPPASFDVTSPVPVTVVVSDPLGLEASQSYGITVQADTDAPRVTLGVSTNLANPGDTVRFLVQASDNVGVTAMTLTVGGQSVALDDTGRASLVLSQPGVYQAVATARDAAGNVGTSAPFELRVFDTSDTAFPDVQILSPRPDRTDHQVTYLTDIIGSVSDANLEYWQLAYARVDLVDLDQIVNVANPDDDDPDWHLIAEGRTNVTNVKLGTFDPTRLLNGPYVIRLMARDVNGLIDSQGVIVNVEGGAKLGNFHLDFTDLQVPLAGIPITVTRVYDTLQADDEGDFGFGWSLGLRDARILETVAPNADFVPDQTKVYLTGPDGRRIGFTYQEQFVSGFPGFGAVYNPYFTPDRGVTETLSVEGQVGKGWALEGLRDPINFSTYILTTQDGTKYRYSQTEGLLRIDEPDGAVVTFTDAGIFHSSGVSITFERDYRGRITEITQRDFQGNSVGEPIRYAYDALRTDNKGAILSGGDLKSVTLQAGLTTRFNYLSAPNAHFLDEAIDPNGNRSLQVIYEDHRFVEVIDAQGNRIDQRDYDLEARTAIVRDGNGNEMSLVYNDRGNVRTETDPLGNVKRYEYTDPINPELETKVIDQRGHVTLRAHDARGNVTQIKEIGPESAPFADPIVTTFTYDTGNNVTRITNDAGQTTTFTYDPTGNLTIIANAQGYTASFTYDTQGRRKTFTDFNGHTTTFEYRSEDCGCSEPRKITFADGTYQLFDHNHFGQVTEEATYEADGTLVEIVTTKYDASGREIEVVRGQDASAIVTRKFYKGSNLDYEMVVNPLSPDETRDTPVNQRQSRITAYDYDSNNRVIRQINPDGGVVEFRYDAQGNRVLLMDPVGNVTTWAYDALNRVREERDPFYWQLFTTGKAINEIDLEAITEENKKPSGASIDTNTSAEHVTVYGYDATGNRIELIDRNGRRREFDFDHAGRQTAERWYDEDDGSLARTMVWKYDALGNLLEAIDPDSHYKYSYDKSNRVTSVDNAGTPNAPNVILNYVYDRQGNVISTSDNSGVTVASEYDQRNRLQVRKWFDAMVNTGEEPDVDPIRIDFAYNAAGRQILLERFAGLDRSTPVGRTVTTHELTGQVDTLTHLNALDELLASYDYGYDFGGLVIGEDRDHQDSAFRQTIVYGYDLNGQLIKADYDTQPDEEFVYDLNGNRITSRNGPTTTTYATGPANQLASDSQFTYDYDGEGNLVRKTEIATGTVTTYEYDHRNRLVRVEERSAGGVIVSESRYTYDIDGRRIALKSGTEDIRMVYHGDNVWLDADTTGDVLVHYLFGNRIDENLARQRPDEAVFYLVDRLGSVRDLADMIGELVNHAELGVFGEVVMQTNRADGDRYLFTGREYDAERRDYYSRARYYNPRIASFTTLDPDSFRAGDWNLYRYLEGNPLTNTDPTGRGALSEYFGGRLALFTAGIAVGAAYTYVCFIEAAGQGVLPVRVIRVLCFFKPLLDELLAPVRLPDSDD